MHIAKSKNELYKLLEQYNVSSRPLGFVPTMGALHTGHTQLIVEAFEQCEWVVCSIFINPTQFNNPEDFEKYPRLVDKDIERLKSFERLIIYLPEVGDLYPQGKSDVLDYHDNSLFPILEGKYRPGHFLGVVTVIIRFLEIIRPDVAYFGLKDYQQYLVVKRAAALYFPSCNVVGIPTVREESGLALSSRNLRLDTDEIITAVAISQALLEVSQKKGTTPLLPLLEAKKEGLIELGFKVEYISVHRSVDLSEVVEWRAGEDYVVLCAAHLAGVRLIDNIIF